MATEIHIILNDDSVQLVEQFRYLLGRNGSGVLAQSIREVNVEVPTVSLPSPDLGLSPDYDNGTTQSSILDESIEILNLPERARNCIEKYLRHHRYEQTIRNLLESSSDDLLSITTFGPKSLMAVRYKLAWYGLHLKGEVVSTIFEVDFTQALPELSERSLNCLRREQINTLRDLVPRQPTELLNITNFGNDQLEEVRKALHSIGLHLGMPTTL